eukprot:TRINITY_DN34614_c0_g1_i1.p1 TRINITY_DN34614_c0_g1~~TRINITY_DN34614_c0_g1_i1.p1  ORF type:complete len:379 (+),score=131.17 TRINITY_DN34614_c0_g1_i1:51-1139(+)
MMKLAMLAVLATAVTGKRLIETAPGKRVWMTEAEVDTLASRIGEKKAFIDVTDYQNVTWEKVKSKKASYPTPGVHKAYAMSVMDDLKGIETDIVNTIQYLGSLHTRYYTTQTGKQATDWLASQYLAAKKGRSDVTIQQFMHSWVQPSLIVSVDGLDKSEEVVIIGGHIDSINGGANGRAPGEDDDGSGSATVFTVFKHLMDNQFKPSRTVEFHAYAAEEVGLRGSQEIAQHYKSIGRNVVAMVQLDCTGYTADGPASISLIQDNTDPDLNHYLTETIAEYCATPSSISSCGYGCSDHASFTNAGYPAAFPFEAPFPQRNPFMHGTQDVLSKINTTHMVEFAKMTIGFVCDVACKEGSELCTA